MIDKYTVQTKNRQFGNFNKVVKLMISCYQCMADKVYFWWVEEPNIEEYLHDAICNPKDSWLTWTGKKIQNIQIEFNINEAN